jgi:hypothetical protein
MPEFTDAVFSYSLNRSYLNLITGINPDSATVLSAYHANISDMTKNEYIDYMDILLKYKQNLKMNYKISQKIFNENSPDNMGAPINHKFKTFINKYSFDRSEKICRNLKNIQL